jgi:PiT family inorganic phosphate transporter
MDALLILTVTTIALIVFFDFTNGFHDTANMIATVIASRAMTPVQAVLLVALFTFLGPLLGGTAVADTIGQFVELSDLPTIPSLSVVLSAVVGAVAWNLLTWWFAIPSSSSHALVGALCGSVLVAAGSDHVLWGIGELLQHGRLVGVTKVLAALLLSPFAGFVAGFLIHRSMRFLLRAARPAVNRTLRHAQFPGTAWLAFSHGTNDAQKSMGIITLVLVLGGNIPSFQVPLWVILLCASAITLGTVSGGWRIVRTVGFGIYKVRPLHAVDAQLTSAAVISVAALVGGPVSTTHVVSSSIMGIGVSERPRRVHWIKAREILVTWLFTIPGAGLIAALCWWSAATLTDRGGL